MGCDRARPDGGTGDWGTIWEPRHESVPRRLSRSRLQHILLLVAYSVRNILWLRCFAVAAALINMPYYLMQPDILWPPVIWGAVFALINLYQIALILWERRPVVLSRDEQTLYDMGFQSVAPRDFVALVMAGQWHDAAPEQALLRGGTPVSSICIALSGTLQLRRRGAVLGEVGPGRIIGTALALLDQPAPLDAVFSSSGRYMCWSLDNIRAFLNRKPELRATMERLASRELAQKVQHLGKNLESFARF